MISNNVWGKAKLRFQPREKENKHGKKLVKFTIKLNGEPGIALSNQRRISIKENTGIQVTEDVERVGFEANIIPDAKGKRYMGDVDCRVLLEV